MTEHAVLDLYAGTGWGVALQALGVPEAGVEIMPEAIDSRSAAGMATPYSDAWDIDNSVFMNFDTLIASPPCQTFSMAGAGAGRKALEQVYTAITSEAWRHPERLREVAIAMGDERIGHVLVPLMYAFHRKPVYIALEQVPPVLPVWQAIGGVLRALGYSVWVGLLQAEQYGVPQTRKRAILMARRDGVEAAPPAPTHSRYYPRTPEKLDEGVEKWVSMAEALGWGMTARPSMTVTGGGVHTGGYEPFGNGARQSMKAQADAGNWKLRSNYGTSGDPENRGERTMDQPAPTLTSKAGRNKVVEQGEVTGRNLTVQEAAILQSYPPYPHWAYERPATTIAGDARAWPPGHKINADDMKRLGDEEARSRYGDRAGTGAYRMSVPEATALQTYPAGFRFAGTKTKQFLQVGNAVPPLLAHHILTALWRTP